MDSEYSFKKCNFDDAQYLKKNNNFYYIIEKDPQSFSGEKPDFFIIKNEGKFLFVKKTEIDSFEYYRDENLNDLIEDYISIEDENILLKINESLCYEVGVDAGDRTSLSFTYFKEIDQDVLDKADSYLLAKTDIYKIYNTYNELTFEDENNNVFSINNYLIVKKIIN